MCKGGLFCILFEVVEGFVNFVKREKPFHPDIELGLNKICIIEATNINGLDPGTPGVVSENKGSTSLTELLGFNVGLCIVGIGVGVNIVTGVFMGSFAKGTTVACETGAM